MVYAMRGARRLFMWHALGLFGLGATQKIPAERGCGVRSVACKARAKTSGHSLIRMLLADARAAPRGRRVVVFDVGANKE